MTAQLNPLEKPIINEFITPRTTSHPLHLHAKESIEILDLGEFNRETDFFARVG